jgi:hypothetical protein
MHHYTASLPVSTVLKDINTLPCPQAGAALLKRNRELGLSQGGLDMRGHVVGPLSGVAIWAIERCDATEKILQIVTDIRVCIFLNGERCRGMLDKQSEQAFSHTLFLAPIDHLVRDIVQPRTVCLGAQSVRYLPHQDRVTERKTIRKTLKLNLENWPKTTCFNRV